MNKPQGADGDFPTFLQPQHTIEPESEAEEHENKLYQRALDVMRDDGCMSQPDEPERNASTVTTGAMEPPVSPIPQQHSAASL